jgi:hypothetical protein
VRNNPVNRVDPTGNFDWGNGPSLWDFFEDVYYYGSAFGLSGLFNAPSIYLGEASRYYADLAYEAEYSYQPLAGGNFLTRGLDYVGQTIDVLEYRRRSWAYQLGSFLTTPPSAGDIAFGLATGGIASGFSRYGSTALRYADDLASSPRLFRFVTEGEVDAIRDTGLLRGGRPGETFFTTQEIKSATRAQQRLSLPQTPTHRVEFEILNNPRIQGPRRVDPDPDLGLSGKSSELLSTDPVKARIINVQPLKP